MEVEVEAVVARREEEVEGHRTALGVAVEVLVVEARWEKYMVIVQHMALNMEAEVAMVSHHMALDVEVVLGFDHRVIRRM